MTLLETAWKERAACARYPDTEERKWWFPDHSTMVEEAREVCRECPVLDECLRHIVVEEAGRKAHGRFGNQAGMSPIERYRFSRSAEARRLIAESDLAQAN